MSAAAAIPTLGEDILLSFSPDRRYARVLRQFPLGVILLFQAVFALTQLRAPVWSDEGLYAYAGHAIVGQNVLHSGPFGATRFTWDDYFSGAPQLYPVLSGVLDALGGMWLVRLFSTGCVLGVTTCVYVLTSTVFGRRCAVWAGWVFAVSSSTVFLSHFATYDAPALLILLGCATVMVRRPGWTTALATGALLAAACLVKYAVLLWVPSVILIPVAAALSRRAVRLACVQVAACVAAGLLAWSLSGGRWAEGIRVTTTGRHVLAPSPLVHLLTITAEAVGGAAVLALLGCVVLWRRRQFRALSLLMVLTLLLAPVHQMQIHEATSLVKHLDFGLALASPLAGVGVVWLLGRVNQFAVIAAVLAFGYVSVAHGKTVFHYVNTRPEVVRVVAGHTVPGATVMTAEAAAFQYGYYRSGSPSGILQWEFPFDFGTSEPNAPAVVALNNVPTGVRAMDRTNQRLIDTMFADARYQLIWQKPLNRYYPRLRWYVWQRK